MKKQLFSLALLGLAWLAGGSTWALEPDGEGYYLIGSKAELQEWTTLDGYLSSKVKLTADIDDVDFMLATAYFTGIFDGDGHTITLNNPSYPTGENKAIALFASTSGSTIKNLTVGGTITTGVKNSAGISTWNGGASTFENVVSIVEINYTGTENASNGGFIGYCKQNATLNNCVAAPKYTGTKGNNNGFIGWRGGGNVYLNNCICIAEAEGDADLNSVSLSNPSSNVTAKNTYVVKMTYDPATPVSNSVYVTKAQMTSGEIAYAINQAAGSTLFYQNLEGDAKDAFPVPFSTHAVVYASGRKHCDLTDYEGVTYNNTSGEPITDPHDYSNFRCNYCGIYYTDYKTPDGEGYYELGTVDDVKWFAGMVNEEHQTTIKGKLTADIDYQGVVNAHTPIGPNITYKYNGIFDGQGHRIKNMIIDSNTNEQGFFGVIRGGTTIRNLIIDSSCSVTGTARIGGLVGSAQVNTASPIIIDNCINEASVNATGAASGILGAAQGNDYPAIQINNCLNRGNITGSPATAFCAWNNRGGSSMTNCLNTGTITGADKASDKFTWYCQLVRFEPGTLTMTNCYDLSGFDGDEDGQQGDQGSLTTSAPLTSGELCYKLGAAWTQVLGTDDYPVPVGNGGQVILNGTYQNTASTLTLNDANSFGTNSDFDVTSVTMSRTLKAGKWNTFCVPFDMTAAEITDQFGTGTEVKELTAATLNDDNYTMTFSNASSIVSGNPYMVRVPGEIDVTSFSLSNKTIKGTITPTTKDDLTFTGVFDNGYAPLNSFIISNNKFYNVDTDANDDGVSEVALKAFRGYITTTSDNNVKALTFDFDDDATGISLMEDGRSQMEDGAIYNIAGQHLDNSQFTIHNSQLKRGIYIVNGKKILK